MRHFLRHPVDIPIDIAISDSADEPRCAVKDIGLGGLACRVPYPLPSGTSVQLSLPTIWPAYRGNAQVVWCEARNGDYEVGLQFTDENEAFKTRMVEQVCQIERYRRTVREREGRELDSEQAADEWIAKYAERFADDFRGN